MDSYQRHVGDAPMPLSRHVWRTLQLAAPIVVSRAAVLVMTVGDTVMTGWAGTEELAALGLGVAPQLSLQMIALGFLQAVPILASQAIGAGRGDEAGAVLRSGLLHALALGLLYIALSFAGAWFFRLTGQPEDLIAKAATVSLVFALGLPGMLLFVTCNMFLESTGRPKTAMIVLIIAALIDILLNGIFALGWSGLVEPMGAVGAVGTSSAMRGLAFLATFAILLRWEARLGDPRGVVKALRGMGDRSPFDPRLRRIGIPIGLAQGVESAAFSALVFLGGAISTQALAAHQAALALMSLIYMSAVGIGGAAAIRVGNAVGRGNLTDLRRAGWSGICLAGAAALPFAALLLFASESVAAVFGLEGEARRLTAATIQVAGLVVMIDALMGGNLGALRGASDVWLPFAIQSGAFWIIAVPLAAALGIGAGFGAPGLIYGILAGVTVSFVLLALRFRVVARRAIAPL